MSNQQFRLKQTRPGDLQDDQLTPAQVALVPSTSTDQDQFQNGILSQLKQIVWGPAAVHHWYDNFSSQGIIPLVSTTPYLDYALAVDPTQPSNNYSISYAGSRVAGETWVRATTSKTLKGITYSYTGNLVTQEVRTVYDTDGLTVLAQLTINYNYTSAKLTSYTATRNV